MVDAQTVEDRGVQIVGGYGFLDDVVGEVASFSVADAAFDPTAGEPDAEAARVVVAAILGWREFSLAVDRAAELAAPDNKSFIKEAALFEIFEEGGLWLISVLALQRQVTGDTAMVVPATMVKLDEAHVALGHATRHQAVEGVAAGLADVGTIHL